MKLNIYGLFNVAYGSRFEGVLCAPNDGMVVRDNFQFLQRAYPHLREDYVLRVIGKIGDDNVLVPVPAAEVVDVSWDSYKFPESPVVKMSPEQVEKLKSE